MGLEGAGCGGKPDSVVATFVAPEHPIRLVLYKSGIYELHRAEDGVPERPYKPSTEYYFRSGRIQAHTRRPPLEAGTYLKTSTNLALDVDHQYLPSPNRDQKMVYLIVSHDGVEYLSDERSWWARKYEETKDTNALRYALRQEKR